VILRAYSRFALPTVSAYHDGASWVAARGGLRKASPIVEAGLEWSKKNSGRLITEITEATADAVAEIVSAAFEAGLAVDEVARQLRGLVGLTSKQGLAVLNLAERLEEEGYTAAEIAEEQALYARKLLDYRLGMIARTEIAMAAIAGIAQAYADNGIDKLLWVADPNCCPICAEQAWQEYSPEEISQLLPAHPNCGCTAVTAAGWSGTPPWEHQGEPWPGL
jgi:hypothetical protein